MRKTVIAKLAAGTCLLGFIIAQPAYAAADEPPQTGDNATEGDIVVTAQRREERQRDVPISITAVTGDTLAQSGVVSTLDLAKIAPGLQLPLYGAFVLPSIRGISANATAVGDSPNVAVYVDGVYQSSVSALNTEMPDTEMVQVLKGPQGTLYGQNAAGGAIIIDTVAPSFEWKGKFSASYGNMNDRAVSGFVAGPISDTLAFELSGAYHRRDGFNRDLLRGGYDRGLRAGSARAKLLWQPSDRASLQLTAFYNEHNDTGVYSNAPLAGNSLGNAMCLFGVVDCTGVPLATKPYTFSTNTLADTKARSYGFSARGKIEFDDIGTISTVTAYNNTYAVDLSDSDGSPVNLVDFTIKIPGHDFIQELNFASTNFGGLSFTAGLFYMNKVESYAPYWSNLSPGFLPPYTALPSVYPSAPAPGSFLSGQTSRYDKKSYAAYFEVSYDLTSKLTLSAGGRYAYEKVQAFNTPTFGILPITPPNPSPLADPRGSVTFKKFTPKAVIRYRPGDDTTFYASYSQGFKSGYVNTNQINACTPLPTCIPAPVKPETVDAFEVGYKGRIANALDVNLAAFHYNYKDIQIFTFTPPAASTFKNAAAGRINGFEFDLSWRATSELTLKFGGTYLDAKYTRFPNADVFIPNGFGNTETVQDVSGNRLMRAPEWALNGSINYRHETSVGTFGLFASPSFVSGVCYDTNNRICQSAYAQLDGELSFEPSAIPGARFVIWGKNLTDKAIYQSVLESAVGDSGSYAQPRSYGARLEYRF